MDHKKDVFDAIGDFMRIPIAAVSGTFTGKLLAEFLGFGGLDQIMIVVISAALFTVAEVIFFRKWARHRDFPALFLAILISITSIGGSVGYYYVAFQRNILLSDQYQQKKAEVDAWLAMSDRETHPETYAWATTKAASAQAELADIRESGAGIGNAFIEIWQRLFGWTAEQAALYGCLFIAVVVEGILIYSAVNEPSPRPVNRPSTKSSPRQPKKPVNVDGKQQLTSKERLILELSTNADYQNNNGQPRVTKIADKVGTSKQYVSRVIKKALA